MNGQLVLSELADYPGFYKAALVKDIAINKDGVMIDIVTGDQVYPVTGFFKYPAIGGKLVHRIMAETFLECPGDPSEYQVNHKDGDKSNSALNNLEWCTVSENATHAYMTGLRPDNKIVFIKDLETGEVTEHFSLNEASRYIGVNAGRLSSYLRSDRDVPLAYKWDACFKNGSFSGLSVNDVGRVKNGYSTPFAVLDAAGNGYLVLSFKGLSEFIKCGKEDILLHLMDDDKQTINGFTIYPLSSYPGKVSDLKRVKIDKDTTPWKRCQKSIKVTNIETNDVVEWPSSDLFCKSLGVKKNTFQKALWRDQNRYKNFFVEYI